MIIVLDADADAGESAARAYNTRSRARTLRCAPRLIFLVVNSANQRSTMLSQLPEVGVKCRWKRGWRSNQR